MQTSNFDYSCTTAAGFCRQDQPTASFCCVEEMPLKAQYSLFQNFLISKHIYIRNISKHMYISWAVYKTWSHLQHTSTFWFDRLSQPLVNFHLSTWGSLNPLSSVGRQEALIGGWIGTYYSSSLPLRWYIHRYVYLKLESLIFVILNNIIFLMVHDYS